MVVADLPLVDQARSAGFHPPDKGVRTIAAALPARMPDATLADAERFLDRLAVPMVDFDGIEEAENLSKLMKPCGFGRYRAGSDYTPRKGVIRHYMISWRLGRDLTMNDKGCRLNRSMQHMH